jgi:hypothetical protein
MKIFGIKKMEKGSNVKKCSKSKKSSKDEN